MSLRVLGVVVGLAFMVTFPLILVAGARYAPRDILACLGALAIGYMFTAFGLTGNADAAVVSSKRPRWAGAAVGALFILTGLHTIIIQHSRPVEIGVAALLILIGAATLWLSLFVRRYPGGGPT